MLRNPFRCMNFYFISILNNLEILFLLRMEDWKFMYRVSKQYRVLGIHTKYLFLRTKLRPLVSYKLIYHYHKWCLESTWSKRLIALYLLRLNPLQYPIMGSFHIYQLWFIIENGFKVQSESTRSYWSDVGDVLKQGREIESRSE